jgi:hypothetical protein
MSGGSGGGYSKASSTTSDPWKPAQPYLKDAMKGASDLLKSGTGYQPYMGETVVPFSSQTQQALTGIENMANQGNPLAGASMDALQGILQGNDNPYYQEQINKQANLLGDDLARQWSAGGRYGSANMATDVSQKVGDLRDQMFSTNWQQNIANQLNAVNAAPAAYESQYAPLERLAQVGAANEDLQQRKDTAAQQLWDQQQQAPWQRLAAANAIFTGNGQLGSSSTQSVAQPGVLQQILGAGALGAGILGSSSQNSILGGLLGF